MGWESDQSALNRPLGSSMVVVQPSTCTCRVSGPLRGKDISSREIGGADSRVRGPVCLNIPV